MRSNFRFWSALSALLAAGAFLVWIKSQPHQEQGTVAWSVSQTKSAATAPKSPALALTTRLANKTAERTSDAATNRARYQLSNVSQPIEALLRVETAILMRNALIDTREPLEMGIPEKLRAGENPGAYIVQARGASAADFQKMLKDAGAEIVAYVPNNAFLVKANSAEARLIESKAVVQSVLPYEPYYKVDSRLMKFVVENETMADDRWLRVTLFPGASEESLRDLAQNIGAKEKSPFGDQVLIQPLSESLAALAQLPEVQIIEPYMRRIAANDLTRQFMGVSEDTVTNDNLHGLTGDKVWLNMNDIGVDSTHPELRGRVFYNGNHGKIDANGHGTHVAGTIVGLGSIKPAFDQTNVLADRTNSVRLVTNVVNNPDGTLSTNITLDGSLLDASFRGMAHRANLFVLSTEDYLPSGLNYTNAKVYAPVLDSYLIETAARTNYVTLKRTNATLISNNSWNYADTPDYDSQAARFDAATRDALPGDLGSQPVLYVFAAGNQGFGDEDGLGGEPGRIASPGTAKNVITVGALEAPRFISEVLTNIEERTEGTNTVKFTNYPVIFRPATDSDDEVAAFSSRGNVGIGVEGGYGRFKPDLVAPGSFIFSAKSKDWKLANDFNPAQSPDMENIHNVLSNLNSVASQYRYDSGTSFSAPAVSGLLALVQEFFTEKLTGDKRRNLSPALMKALLINSARTLHSRYDLQVQNRINYQGWGATDLHRVLPTNLVTLEEKDWPLILVDQSPTNAVSTGLEQIWNLQLDTNGLAFPLRITLVWTDPPGNPAVGVKLVNDLDLVVIANSNRVFHGNDFIGGHDFSEGRPGQEASDEFADRINNVENVFIGDPRSFTNLQIRVVGRKVNVKAVNDLYETVKRTNEIAQDFALVISSDNPLATNVFAKFEQTKITNIVNDAVHANLQQVVPMINGIELTNQRAGANSPLFLQNGATNQWRFFVFTNNNETPGLLPAGSNVAFAVSLPVNIGIPRNADADMDMYISLDSDLTNLSPAVVSGAWKSRASGGSESVVFTATDAIPGTTERAPQYVEGEGGVVVGSWFNKVFYVAVKSEDQQAGDFSLVVISTDLPFEEDRDGIRVIYLRPTAAIPDGVPNRPQGRSMYGFPLRAGRILESSVYMAAEHEEFGDLVGSIHHNGIYTTLYNHNLLNGDFTGTNVFVFSDSYYANRFALNPIEYPPGLYPYLGIQPTFLFSDGPGTLANYAGIKAQGFWQFDVFDSAATHTGRVAQAEVHVKPLREPLLNGELISGTVQPNSAEFFLLDVPSDASKVTLTLTQKTGDAPLLMLVRRDYVPSTNINDFDYVVAITNSLPSSVTLVIDENSKPPLIPGEYFIVLLNVGAQPADFDLLPVIERGAAGANLRIVGNSFVELLDDAKTVSSDELNEDLVVADAAVAIVSTNARVSDLVLHLVSPQGTRVLLMENRGRFAGTGLGTTNLTPGFDKFSYVVFTDNPEQRPVKFAPAPYLGDNLDFRGIRFQGRFEGALQRNYTAPALVDGWNVRTGRVSIVSGDAAEGLNYIYLNGRSLREAPGAISHVLPTIRDRSYKLRFKYRGAPKFARAFVPASDVWTNLPNIGPLYSTGQDRDPNSPIDQHINVPPGVMDLHYHIINEPDPNFPGPRSPLWVADPNFPPFPAWFANDSSAQWIALMPRRDDNHPQGTYVHRTSFIIHGDPDQVRVVGRIAYEATNPSHRIPVSVNVGGPQESVANSGLGAYSAPFEISNQARVPARFVRGVNTIDFTVPQDNSGPVGFRVQLQMQLSTFFGAGDPNSLIPIGPASSTMRLAGVETNEVSIVGAPEWRGYETEFIADRDLMLLEFFAGNTNPGLEIDDVELEDTGTVYMNPEEPLAILQGQRAMGEWRLEAWDNRTGATNPAMIIDWQVLLRVANAPRRAEKLLGGATYPKAVNNPVIRVDPAYYTPGAIDRNETEWFYYDVCPDSTELTIRLRMLAPLRDNNLELLIDRSGFPTGNPNTDDYIPFRTRIERGATDWEGQLKFTLTSPIAAPLRPGERMYFAVRSLNPFRTANYQLTVIDSGLCVFVPPRRLAAGQRDVAAAIPASASAYYPGERYDLQTDGAASVEVTLNDPGQLTILAAKGFEPTAQNFQIKQTVTSTGDIQLPSGGTWNLRVINPGDDSVGYSLLLNPQAGLALRDAAVVDGRLRVSWDSAPGVRYQIFTSANLTEWTPGPIVDSAGIETTYSDSAPADGAARFIKIAVVN